MQFQTMKEFLVLAETLNFLEAAERLYISQATLSKHIREMEKELDITLFNRSTRKVELTEIGMRMIPYARQAAALHADYTQEVDDYKDRMNNYLAIGCVNHWDDIDLGKLTMDFQRSHPNVHIHIITSESDELLTMVANDSCHFAIVRERPDLPEDGMSRILLCEDPLYAFLPKKSPLAANERIELSQLKDEFFLLESDNGIAYRLGVDACKDAGFLPNVIYRGGPPQAINYLMNGLGVYLMFRSPLGPGSWENEVVRCSLAPKVHANINLAYKESCLTDAGKVFLKFMQEYTFD